MSVGKLGQRKQTMIATLMLTALLATSDGQLKTGDHNRSLEVGGRTRMYLVHIPKSYDGTRPFPVVLPFHGGGSNAQQMVRFWSLNGKAEEAGFLVIYPYGTGRLEDALTWNGGNSTRNISANDAMWEFFVKHPTK